MDSIYGNEWKNREKDLLSADQISRMKIVQNASPPLVLNVAHWNCFSPKSRRSPFWTGLPT